MLAGAVAAAGSGTMTVSAVVLSKSNCKFSGGATGPALNFGTLDITSTSNITASVNTTITCNGSAAQATFAMGSGNGLYFSGGSKRMRHSTTLTEFLPYAISFSPASATVNKGTPTTVSVIGTITPANFQNAVAGSYSDTVSITIVP